MNEKEKVQVQFAKDRKIEENLQVISYADFILASLQSSIKTMHFRENKRRGSSEIEMD